MKKSEAMDLYEGLNGISPKMIEEAGNYKKTASVDIRYKKSDNVKKIMARWYGYSRWYCFWRGSRNYLC